MKKIQQTKNYFYGFSQLTCYMAREAAAKATKHKGSSGHLGRGSEWGKALSCFARITGLLLALLTIITTSQAFGENSPDTRTYDIVIPQLDAATALNQLAEQTDVYLLFPYQDAKSRQANAVVGRYTLMDALSVMLQGSGLSGGLSEEGVIRISVTETERPIEDQEERPTMSTEKNMLTAVVGYLLAFSANADTATTTEDLDKDKKLGGYAIQEILVTATKRETRLQDTAMSISALDGETIEKRGLIGMNDYLSTIPGVTMQERGANANSIVIRGISSNPQYERAATGIYFGDIPVSGMSHGDGAGSTDLKMVDIERVEVLKGPQGTLYGADAMGGVVRIIPAAPNLEQVEGKVAAQYSYTGGHGSDNSRVEGVFNLPVMEDTLALRGVAYHIDNSGYIKSIAPTDIGGDNGNLFEKLNTYGGSAQIKGDIGANETNGARLSALWRPVEKLNITLAHTWQKTDEVGLPQVELNLPGRFEQTRLRSSPEIPAADNGIRPAPEEGRVDESHLTSLVADYDLGWGRLYSTSSRIDREGSWFYDWSYYNPSMLGFGGYHHENDVFAQEIRFSSQFEGPIQVILGGYYEDREGHYFFSEGYSGDPEKAADAVIDQGWVACCLDPFPNAPEELREGYWYLYHGIGATKQKAIFGEIAYTLADQLTATVGVRHFEYNQESYYFQTGWWINSLSPVKSTPLESDFSDENYKVNLSWKPNDDTLLYAQWAEGFRLGGPQASKPSYCDANNNGKYEIAGGGEAPVGVVNPDLTENFELGYKASFADNRISLNAALYRINWEGLPVTVNLAGTGCGIYTVNAGESTSEGIEVESRLRLTDNLLIDVGVSYNEAKLKGKSSLGNDGDDLPGSADINLSAGLEYAFTLSGHDAFARIDYAYVGEYDTYIHQPDSVPSSGNYTQIHLKAGATFGQTSVDLFVKNLTNADDLTWVENFTGTGHAPRAYRLYPRIVGVNFSYSF